MRPLAGAFDATTKLADGVGGTLEQVSGIERSRGRAGRRSIGGGRRSSSRFGPDHGETLAHNAKGAASLAVSGLTGIVMDPLKGAAEGGITGFLA